MALEPCYRERWLREDLLRILNGIQTARIYLAQGATAMAEGTLQYHVDALAHALAAPALPALADLLADEKAKEAESAP